MYRIRCAMNTKQFISYNDPSIQWLGRWVDSGVGKYSGWTGSQIVFKVSGTLMVHIIANVTDPDATAFASASVNIDNSTSMNTEMYWSSIAKTATGERVACIRLSDTNEHSIIVRSNGDKNYVFSLDSQVVIKGFFIDRGGSINIWNQGNTVIQTVGDSWMGAGSVDWPRLMSTSFKLWPVASGGRSCSVTDTNYNFDYSGQSNTSDINADAVIVSLGVNDYNASVTTAAFETSMYSLYDKIRIKQPTAKIFLIRVPKNVAAAKDYGQYGANMATVVAARSNCFYVDTTSLDATIEWASGDVNHLSPNGRQTLANFVKAELIADGI